MDRPLCSHFIAGSCAWGSKCRKRHDIAAIASRSPVICQHYLQGTCRYGFTCKKDHGNGSIEALPVQPIFMSRGTCRHYLQGNCRFGLRCTKYHPGRPSVEAEEELCTFFNRFRGGGCDKGINCFFKHLRAGKPLPTSVGSMEPIQMIASYSITRDHRVEYSDRARRQFQGLPTSGIRLDQGKDEFVRNECCTPTNPQTLESLLRALIMVPGGMDMLTRSNVVTRRGILTKLMMRLKIRLNVSFIDDIVFIEESSTSLDEYKPKSPFSAVSSSPDIPDASQCLHPRDYAARVFEQLCTEEAEPQAQTGVVAASERWITIGQRKIGDLHCIIGGEVDCVDENGGLLELKVRSIRGQNDDRFWRRAYLQSLLLDISDVVVGFHDFDLLDNVVSYKLDDLREKFHPWDPNEAISLGHHILKNIRQCCLRESRQSWRARAATEDNDIWDVVYGNDPHGEPVSVRRFNPEEVKSLQNSRDPAEGRRIGIVPVWVIDAIRTTKSKQILAARRDVAGSRL